ncbi:hypothetical protein HY734_01085 [Candidatus Uhrbacteria bacterium]|nr:hypothetical protein [Candidatus Uhrbacteria bacterium]
MFHTPTYDAKIKPILDALQPGERVCALSGEAWRMDEMEIGWYRKFNVPPSRYSPLARMKLLYTYFIVFDVWYNRHADTGKPMVSNIHPATGIRVLSDEEWYTRDFSEMGAELDLDRPFFDQLYALSRRVPRAAGYNFVPPERSLAFLSFGDRDSYFVLASQTERCFSCTNAYEATDCAEVAMIHTGNLSCNVLHSNRIFRSAFVRESYDCIDCRFVFDCRNCEFCFGATNKRNKKYLWFNEQLSKEEWEKRISQVDLSSWKMREEYERKFHELVTNAVWPENFNVKEERSTGEYLNGCVDCSNCYYLFTPGSSNLDHVMYGLGDAPARDSYMSVGIGSASDCYYGIGMNNSARVKFALSLNANCLDCEYSESCFNCEHCFGCVGLRHKKFHILNRPYSEEDYWKTIDALKCAMLERGEYGELPPARFSTQVCKGSGAGVIYNITDAECRRLGAAEFDAFSEGAEGPSVDSASIRKLEDLPDRIDGPAIAEWAGKPLIDAKMGRRFAYLKPELELYAKLGIAPPRSHPTSRLISLYREMNTPVLEDASCASCGTSMQVSKNLAYPERKMYCKSCYLEYLERNG